MWEKQIIFQRCLAFEAAGENDNLTGVNTINQLAVKKTNLLQHRKVHGKLDDSTFLTGNDMELTCS